MADPIRNWRKLCAELLQGLDENRHPEVRYPGHLRLVMAAARTALAAEQGPAAPDWVREAFAELERRQENLHRFRDLRTALAGEPPAPVPVAERPGERDGWCDAEGRCWWFAPVEAMPGGFRSAGWGLYAPDPADEDTHCLPHWASLQPPQGVEVAT